MMKLRKWVSVGLVITSMMVMSQSIFADPQVQRNGQTMETSTSAQAESAFGVFYSTDSQVIPANGAVTFQKNRLLHNVSHTPGTQSIVIQKEGVYDVSWFTVAHDQSLFDLRVNGVSVPGSVTPSPGSGVSTACGSTLVFLEVGNTVTVNNASGNPTSWSETLQKNPWNSNTDSVTARLKIVRIL